MAREIKESDWKLFRRLHKVALERFCRRVLEEVNQATSNCTGDYHERYLEVFNLIKKRDKELGWAFDDPRRSKAFILLANIKGSDLLTEEEFSQFSPETGEAVEAILGIRRM
jgi:hypothetical protein